MKYCRQHLVPEEATRSEWCKNPAEKHICYYKAKKAYCKGCKYRREDDEKKKKAQN